MEEEGKTNEKNKKDESYQAVKLTNRRVNDVKAKFTKPKALEDLKKIMERNKKLVLFRLFLFIIRK